MRGFLRTKLSLLLVGALVQTGLGLPYVLAQEKSSQERVIRDIEARGFHSVSGLRRRGGHYVFQAQDFFGNKVQVVMNAESGEIVGLSRVMPIPK